MNITCKKIKFNELVEYQKNNGTEISLSSGSLDEFLQGTIAESKFSQEMVTIYLLNSKKTKQRKLIFYNPNFWEEIKNQYKKLFIPFLIWLGSAIIAVIIGAWLEWGILIVVAVIAVLYRIYSYLNVFSLVSKKIQFLNKKVIDDNLIAEGEKITFDDMKFISLPTMEIIYFTKKGNIPEDGFIIWDDSDNRYELINLFKKYCQEIKVGLRKIA